MLLLSVGEQPAANSSASRQGRKYLFTSLPPFQSYFYYQYSIPARKLNDETSDILLFDVTLSEFFYFSGFRIFPGLCRWRDGSKLESGPHKRLKNTTLK
jgi:hypothetical protein